jgi:CRP/FNR family transcriptional regulator
MQAHCFAQHLDEDVLAHLAQSITHRHVPRGSYVYRMGEPFDTLYFVQAGFFKSAVLNADGQTCIVGFPMAGDVMGLDGCADGRHNSQAMALQDSTVCELPFQSMLALSLSFPALQQSLHRMMSREITRNQKSMLLLGSLPAEEKLLAFLQSLSQRFAAHGIAAGDFNLPMSREDIASYLGLQMETVSRAFTKLHAEGLINVHRRRVRIDTARAA